ncbi:MAG: DUF1269 domain-containing protein [Caldilineaceae bacterium]
MSQQDTTVVIGSFAESGGAEVALHQIKDRPELNIRDAAFVVKSADGKLQFTDTRDWGWGKGALAGGVVGALIALIAPPIGLGIAALGAGAGAIGAAARDAGISDDALKALGETLAAGASAAVLAVNPASAQAAEEALTQAGATTARQGFSQEVIAVLHAMDSAGEHRDQTMARDLNKIGRAM